MSFVLAPLSKVRDGTYGPYQEVRTNLQDKAIERAKTLWNGYEFGGLNPGEKQFGITPLRAREMAHDVTATTLSGTYNFRKNIGATGWYTIFDYSTRTDILHAFCGFKVADPSLKLLEFRMEMGDKKFPIIDVQEARDWGGFALLYKVDKDNELIADPETSVYVRAYMEATGYTTVIPLGFMLYKRKDLVISES